MAIGSEGLAQEQWHEWLLLLGLEVDPSRSTASPSPPLIVLVRIQALHRRIWRIHFPFLSHPPSSGQPSELVTPLFPITDARLAPRGGRAIPLPPPPVSSAPCPPRRHRRNPEGKACLADGGGGLVSLRCRSPRGWSVVTALDWARVAGGRTPGRRPRDISALAVPQRLRDQRGGQS